MLVLKIPTFNLISHFQLLTHFSLLITPILFNFQCSDLAGVPEIINAILNDLGSV